MFIFSFILSFFYLQLYFLSFFCQDFSVFFPALNFYIFCFFNHFTRYFCTVTKIFPKFIPCILRGHPTPSGQKEPKSPRVRLRINIGHIFPSVLLNKMTQKQTLHERIGGDLMLESIVDKYYIYMLDDKKVKQFFKHTDMHKLRKRQTQFWVKMTGGDNNYEGKDMKSVHQNMGIGHMEFDATWENFKKSLHQHKIDSHIIKEMHELFYSEQNNIITKN